MSLKYHIKVDPEAANDARAKIIRMAGEGKRVLELGCHAGDVSRELVKRGARVWGVELDRDAAALAEESCEKVIVADLDELDPKAAFGDERFDLVVIGDVLEHLADPLKILKDARGLLAPGGAVLVSVPNIAHVSVRIKLLAGAFPYDPSGILDRTHRRFFTRPSLEKLLAEAGLDPAVWDQVSRPWPTERIGEELAAIGVPATPELLKLLSSPDASAFQWVIKAQPVERAAKDPAVILICPETAPPAERLSGWIGAAPGGEVTAIMPSTSLDKGGPPIVGAAGISIRAFPDPASIGRELNAALPSPLSGKVVLVHASLRPDRELIDGLLGGLGGSGGEEVAGAWAKVVPAKGSGDKWWTSVAAPPIRKRDLCIEFCQGINLCVNASWFAEERFAEDLPYPWVMVEWINRLKDRELGFALAEDVEAASDFIPRVGAMAAAYKQYGAMLAALADSRPAFVTRALPKRLTIGKKIRQAPRGLSARFSSQLMHAKYFERMRADSLNQGFKSGRSTK